MKKIELAEIDFTKLLAVAYSRVPNVYSVRPFEVFGFLEKPLR
jgi:hypothetical protein